MEISLVVEQIRALKIPAIIGVSGFGGAGKSTFAEKLGEALGAPIVGVDSFIKDKMLTEYSNWDLMDFKRLEEEVLKPFAAGEKGIAYGHFDWGANAVLKKRTIPEAERLVVEGVGLFRPELSKYFSYTVWIDCPLEESVRRGKLRDRGEQGEPHDELWDGIWKKNDEEYLKHFAPKEKADCVLQSWV